MASKPNRVTHAPPPISAKVTPNGTTPSDETDFAAAASKPQARHSIISGSAIEEHEDSTGDATDDSVEDYDDLELDPHTLVANSRKSMDEAMRPAGLNIKTDNTNNTHNGTSDEMLSAEVKVRSPPPTSPRQPPPPTSPSISSKRNSIPVRLERTGTKGRYVLTPDDPVIKDILRKGIEREELESVGRKPRTRFRDLVFTRQFTTFDRQNPLSADSPFFGFFTLFWLAMVILLFQVAMHNWRDYGSVLGQNQILKMMFSHDVYVLGLTDGVMCAAAGMSFVFQKMIQWRWFSWSRGGWVLQNVWQSLYLAAVIGWTYFRAWPWTHTIFIVLHGLVFLMKQHSFAFYNGYLSGVRARRAALELKRKQLEQMEPNASSPSSPRASFQLADFSSGVDLNGVNQLAENSKGNSSSSNAGGNPSASTSTTTKRRSSAAPRNSVDFTAEKSDVASVAAAIESGRAIDASQLKIFNRIISQEIDELTRELQGKSPEGRNAYPRNLSLYNFFEYICLPTLVYELEYPRQERINWWYVLEKLSATFGVLAVMMVISQGFIYPPVAKTVRMKEAGMPIEQRWREFPFIVSDMLFPLLVEQLLTWYLIWECILNLLAELTCFADRGFYGDWWNSVTWDQYARDWNRPVHNFLLRHVYHSSISTFHLSRQTATFATFLLSALVHEMCMALMFKKVRGYLFWMQLMQMPLVTFSRSRLMKGRVILGNVIFWLGLFVGPSVLTALYLVI